MTEGQPELTGRPGYMMATKTAITNAVKAAFGADHPVPEYRGLLVSLEFPAKKEAYPSIWVDFDPAFLAEMGISHRESYPNEDPDQEMIRVRRWRFTGSALFTVVALSSAERDSIFDYLVAHLAFGRVSDQESTFHARMAENDLIGVHPNYDSIDIRGAAATSGTPWDTEDVVYEITVVLALDGEFAVAEDTGDLVYLSEIVIDAYPTGGAPAEGTFR